MVTVANGTVASVLPAVSRAVAPTRMSAAAPAAALRETNGNMTLPFPGTRPGDPAALRPPLLTEAGLSLLTPMVRPVSGTNVPSEGRVRQRQCQPGDAAHRFRDRWRPMFGRPAASGRAPRRPGYAGRVTAHSRSRHPGAARRGALPRAAASRRRPGHRRARRG